MISIGYPLIGFWSLLDVQYLIQLSIRFFVVVVLADMKNHVYHTEYLVQPHICSI